VAIELLVASARACSTSEEHSHQTGCAQGRDAHAHSTECYRRTIRFAWVGGGGGGGGGF